MKKVLIAGLAALALASPLAMAKNLTMCTGLEGGFYDSFGKQIGTDVRAQSNGDIDVAFQPTKGSVDSANKLKKGDCEIAILQADAVTSRPMPADLAVTDAHEETIYWIHGANGVSDFDDMSSEKNKNLGIAIVGGSGAEVTLRNFGLVDKKFKDMNIVPFTSWFRAAKATSEGRIRKGGNDILIAGMIYVGRQGNLSTEITGEFKDSLSVGEIDVSSFKNVKDANGQPLYFTCPVGKTNGLATSTKWGKPDTYCVKAQVVYNNEVFRDMDEDEASEIQTLLDKTIIQNVRQQRAAK